MKFNEKRCTKCYEVKHISLFSERSWCKSCRTQKTLEYLKRKQYNLKHTLYIKYYKEQQIKKLLKNL